MALDDYTKARIREVVAAAPPLTDEAVAEIRALLFTDRSPTQNEQASKAAS